MKGKKGRFLGLRRGDLLLGAGVLLAGAVLLGGAALFSRRGGQAVLTTPEGERPLPLSEDVALSIQGDNGIPVVIRVEDGAVWFERSGCPDQICVHSGRLTRTGETAACLPAGVLLRVEEGAGGESAPVDAVAG